MINSMYDIQYHVCLCFQLVNQEMFWVIGEVCSELQIVKRAKIIKNFIRIASKYIISNIKDILNFWSEEEEAFIAIKVSTNIKVNDMCQDFFKKWKLFWSEEKTLKLLFSLWNLLFTR